MPYKRFPPRRDTFLVTEFRQFLPLKGLFQQPLPISQVIRLYGPRDMTKDLARYVVAYYGHLMMAQEMSAYRHLVTTMKSTRGGSDSAAQERARGTLDPLRSKWLSNDPQVLALARDGYDIFTARTAERILRENLHKVLLNLCPSCGELARTPAAKQCRFCRRDWHEGGCTSAT